MVRWTLERGLVAVLLVLCSVPLSLGVSVGFGDLTAAAQGSTISSVVVQGNQRVEAETIRSYLTFSAGDPYDPGEINQSLKTLFATGLFKDVRIRRQFSSVVVVVVENPVVARVRFEGNDGVESDTLRAEIQTKPRSVYTQARVQADEQRIRDVLARQGLYDAQVSAQVIPLGNNRVEVVYQIGEGVKTKVKAIRFVGNDSFSSSQLRFVITTKRTGWLSFLKNDNIYDPDRLGLDRELLRQFYLKNGYADVRILSSNADIEPGGGGGLFNRDTSGFVITFEIYEGPRYDFGYVDVESSLPSLDVGALGGALLTKPGKRYNVEKVEKTVEALTVKVSEQGYAFGQVRPRFDRDPTTQTINITYVIDEGPRVYIERINIVGNYRTEDQVIRRQFRLAEGDAYNRLLIEAARKRLRSLGFFKTVDIQTEPGSAPDRVVINVVVVEQPTGEFSFGVGYSTTEGVIGDVSVSERNLMGRGQYVRLGLSGSLERFQIDFSFTEPAFLGRNIAAGFDIFHKEVDLTAVASFKQRDTGGNLRIGFPVANNTQLGLRYRLQREEIYDASRDASLAIKQAAEEGAVIVSSLGYTLAYDTRNLPQQPTSGIFASVSQD
ncbi:MAG: outer membrane protein assembly factor BamA, partial [Pseudomonadota bacterium]